MAAYSKHTNPEELPLMIYAASKTLGEQALWRWVEQEQPHFTVNAVLPNFNVRTPGTLESCGMAQDVWLVREADQTNLSQMGKAVTPNVTTGSMPPVRALLNGAKPWVEVILPRE